MLPVRGPHRRARAANWPRPLAPLAISAAAPAANGAASPVCTRVGIVTNAMEAEANTHGARGMAQLNACHVPWPTDGSGTGVGFGPGTVARCDAKRPAIAAATRTAATAKDNRMPNRPAEAITPEANGPTAKPTIKTAPAIAAPAGPP